MEVSKNPQRSPGWVADHLGMITASYFPTIIIDSKRSGQLELSDKRHKIKWKVVAERLSGQRMYDDVYKDRWIWRGIKKEAQARADFANKYQIPVQEIGFVTADDKRFGCSPDGITPDGKTIVEIKIPAPFTHLQYLVEGTEAYLPQYLGQLWICKAELVVFYSWHETWKHYHVSYDHNHRRMNRMIGLLQEFGDEVDKAELACRKQGILPSRHPDEWYDYRPGVNPERTEPVGIGLGDA